MNSFAGWKPSFELKTNDQKFPTKRQLLHRLQEGLPFDEVTNCTCVCIYLYATIPRIYHLQGGEYTQQTYRQQADMFKQHWLLRHPQVYTALQDALQVWLFWIQCGWYASQAAAHAPKAMSDVHCLNSSYMYRMEHLGWRTIRMLLHMCWKSSIGTIHHFNLYVSCRSLCLKLGYLFTLHHCLIRACCCRRVVERASHEEVIVDYANDLDTKK